MRAKVQKGNRDLNELLGLANEAEAPLAKLNSDLDVEKTGAGRTAPASSKNKPHPTVLFGKWKGPGRSGGSNRSGNSLPSVRRRDRLASTSEVC